MADGTTQTRIEVVHDPVVISQYMKRRTEADLELREYVYKTTRSPHRSRPVPRVWNRLPPAVRALHRVQCLVRLYTTPKVWRGPGSVVDFVGIELRAPAYVYLAASTAHGLRAMPTMTALQTLGMLRRPRRGPLRPLTRRRIKKELERLEKNKARRQAREQQKELHQKASAGDAGSPGPGAEKIPTGTTRKCANCGQVGHIKTNKKYSPRTPSAFRLVACT